MRGLLLAAGLLAGCSSTPPGQQEPTDPFAWLAPGQSTAIEKQKLDLGASPDEVRARWGPPSHTKTEDRADGPREIWLYTRVQPTTRYRVVPQRDPDTGRVSYREEPLTRYLEIVEREAVFKGGRLDAWRLFPPALRE